MVDSVFPDILVDKVYQRSILLQTSPAGAAAQGNNRTECVAQGSQDLRPFNPGASTKCVAQGSQRPAAV